MEKIYLALVDTPGLFASMIRKYTGISYVHVVLGLDQDLNQAYSFGRRNPQIPLIAGFERENLPEIYRAFPTARYKIMSLDCTLQQKKSIEKQLERYYYNRFHYHYCILGLPFLLGGIPFYQKRHYTCSSFVARILSENGISLFDKHFSLVTPKDFYELTQTETIYEGSLEEFLLNGRYTCGSARWENLYES